MARTRNQLEKSAKSTRDKSKARKALVLALLSIGGGAWLGQKFFANIEVPMLPFNINYAFGLVGVGLIVAGKGGPIGFVLIGGAIGEFAAKGGEEGSDLFEFLPGQNK